MSAVKKGLIILLFSLSAILAAAQNNFFILYSPQYLINNQAKGSIGMFLNNKQCISFSPSSYFGTTKLYLEQRNSDENGRIPDAPNPDAISGFGIDIEHQLYFRDTAMQISFYASYGVGYNSLRLNYADFSWNPYTKNGLEYYHYSFGEHQEEIIRWDLFILLGSRFKSGAFVLQWFAGPVYKYSEITTTPVEDPRSQNNILDFGFKGITLRIGGSFGFSF